MTALLVVAVCLLVVLGVALSGFLLWLSCKICRVARPAAKPGGKPRGVGYGRALLCALGLAVVGNAVGVALFFAFSAFRSSSIALAPPNLLLSVASICLVLFVHVLFLRFALPASLGKSILVTLLSNVFSIVFAVSLFFALRAGVFEAFVIPTGTMAETLLGYHKMVTCPQCGYTFPVNCSQQVDPQDPPPDWIRGCTCPNCRQHIAFIPTDRPGDAPPRDAGDAVPDPGPLDGDRLVVGKGLFGLDFFPPQRLDLMVFQYPGDFRNPQPTPSINYIKRLVGLPDETIAIHGGDLYVLPPDKRLQYDDLKNAADPAEREQLWQQAHMHVNDTEALQHFQKGDFEIMRKSPDQIMAIKRIVYDCDHPAKDLPGPRWADRDKDAVWKADEAHGFHLAPSADDKVHWLGYRHLLRDPDDKPQLITDFLGYNTWEGRRGAQTPGENWVGDLILECDVQADAAQGELTLELSKGVDRFRALWTLTTGVCMLLRVHDGKEETLDSKPTALKSGLHHLRFANVDQRLTVWVDDALAFGDGVTYKPPETEGPTQENDLEPAGIGLKGTGATVRALRLWRDAYYTTAVNGNPGAPDAGYDIVDFAKPSTWDRLGKLPVKTFYVQPDCYFVLGDNSPQSSDSRSWGLVPRRLLLGKAFLVYYPLDRAGWVR